MAAFREYGLPKAIRTDYGAPFASLAIRGLSPGLKCQLSPRPDTHAAPDEGVRGYTKTYCGNPFDATSTLSVTVPRFWPALSAVQLNVCQVPFCVAEVLMVSWMA
jgi:hypothetical protein